jgi:hypothetical protein
MKTKTVRPAVATWYMVNLWFAKIEPVQIVSFSPKSVTYLEAVTHWGERADSFRERLAARESSGTAFFPDFEEAKDWLSEQLQKKLDGYQRMVDEYSRKIEKATAITKEGLSE